MTTHLLKSWLFLSLFALFLSCRNEYLVNDDFKNQKTITARQIRFEELRQIPDLIGKISEIKKSENLSTGKIYSDSVNDFSVNTDYCLFIEDENQNKTYTFKIERNPTSPLFKNLVLKDIGHGAYDAYISQYDNVLLHNENPNTNDVKTYFQLNYIGQKGNELFGKYATCTYTITSTFYVPGELCIEGLHSYGEPCAYLGTNNAATQGYNTTQYTTIYYDCDAGTTTGGDSNGGGVSGGSTPGDVPTSPYPNTNNAPNPCIKIKADLAKAKTIANNITIKSQNNTMKANIITDSNEKQFFFGKNSRGIYQVSPIQTLSSEGGNAINTGDFAPEGDFHNHNGADTPPSPSPVDIYGLHNSNSDEPLFGIRFVNGSDGSLYALTITNQTDFDQFVQNNPLATTVNMYDVNTNATGNNFWIKDSDIYNDYLLAAQYFVDKGYSQNDAFAYSMAFVGQKYKMGVITSKKNNNGDFKPIGVIKKRNQFNPENEEFEPNTPCNL